MDPSGEIQPDRLDHNQLHRSANPYLSQHSHNPVWWQEWSSRVIDQATGLGRPLFISIGYSTCHWCHVMEEESFSDPELAEILNRYFISIKIDREERPDLDTYYMNTAHFMGVAGGWPLNVFANSQGVPFWICTYAPPQPRHGLASFKDIVTAMGETWEKSSQQIADQTYKNAEFMKGFFAAEISVQEKDADLKNDFFMKQHEFIENHQEYFDEEWGGFKFQSRIKFPNLMGLDHLLELSAYTLHKGKEPTHLFMAMKSIASLIRGGIYDHLGGGLFRYSTDYQWKVPHFEKMLYDNALLVEILADAYRLVKEVTEHSPPSIQEKLEPVWARLYDSSDSGESRESGESGESRSSTRWLQELKVGLEKTIGYWNQEMTVTVDGSRVFLAAQDAGDKESEGSYYAWTFAEINDLLTPEEMSLFYANYDMYPFSRTKATFLLGRKNRFSPEVREIERRLLAFRKSQTTRKPPFKDQKILLSWNAMMVCSYLEVFQAFGDEGCRERALETLNFLDGKMCSDSLLLHHLVVGNSEAGSGVTPSPTLGFLGDYAHLSRALLMAYRLSGERHFLERCLDHCQTILKYFYKDGQFSEVNPHHHDTPISTLIEAHDGVEPSSQSLLAELFLQLDLLYPSQGYREKAEAIFKQFYQFLGKTGLPYLTRCFHNYQNGLSMIAVYGEDYGEDQTSPSSLWRSLGSRYLSSLPFLNPKVVPSDFSSPPGGKAHAVICHGNRCSPPLNTPQEIEDYLNQDKGETL